MPAASGGAVAVGSGSRQFLGDSQKVIFPAEARRRRGDFFDRIFRQLRFGEEKSRIGRIA
jgi:hypothetical protein